MKIKHLKDQILAKKERTQAQKERDARHKIQEYKNTRIKMKD